MASNPIRMCERCGGEWSRGRGNEARGCCSIPICFRLSREHDTKKSCFVRCIVYIQGFLKNRGRLTG